MSKNELSYEKLAKIVDDGITTIYYEPMKRPCIRCGKDIPHIHTTYPSLSNRNFKSKA